MPEETESDLNEKISNEKIKAELRKEDKPRLESMYETINRIRQKGYNDDFQMTEEGFTSKMTGKFFQPEELTIDYVYRFEGESNPDDMSALYAISSDIGITKGMFVDSYGVHGSYNSQSLIDFLRKVKRAA
ncbi:MAG: phosphoribosylpyrophosphate synthetase [Bacteroidota bacterium]